MPMIYGCAGRLGNHPHHRRSPVHPTISAKDGEPDAEKPNPRGGSPFADYGEKKIGGSIRSEDRFVSALKKVV